MAAITGNYLFQYWKKAYGQPYTGYWSPNQWNILFEECLINSIEKRYTDNQDMKRIDEMATFIKTNVVIGGFGNNSINLRPIPIISLTYSGTLWTLKTTVPFAPLSAAAGKFIYISGVTGFATNPNGTNPVQSFVTTIKGCVQLTFTAPSGGAGTYKQYSGTMAFQNNANATPNLQLLDYIHLLNIKCKFSQPIYDVTPTTSTNGTPIVVTLSFYNKIRSSNWKDNNVQVTMSGWNTNTSANGTFYVKKINNLQFSLYTDIYLRNPVAGIANESNSNISFSLAYYNSANKYLSTQKSNSLNVPSWKSPAYERMGRLLNIYPMNIFGGSITTPCTEVTLDYVANPPLPYVSDQQNQIFSGLFVDANDNSLDLTDFYSEKFLYSVCQDLALDFVKSARDMSLNEIVIQDKQINP